jgi:2,3-bisphosphoglycerate-independent phosphoglycerate mutase
LSVFFLFFSQVYSFSLPPTLSFSIYHTPPFLTSLLHLPFSSSYTLVITADHGNAEEMLDHLGRPKTSHTTNLIPLIIAFPPISSTSPLSPQSRSFRLISTVQDANKESYKNGGGLADVAPTILTLMGLHIPREMTGKSLVEKI